MEGIDKAGENPEGLLVGSDRPRPLPALLRSELEGALLDGAAGWSETAKPLPHPARQRLASTLSSDLAPKAASRWWKAGPLVGVAAAAVVVAVAVLPGGGHPSSRVSTGATYSASGEAGHSAPVPAALAPVGASGSSASSLNATDQKAARQQARPASRSGHMALTPTALGRLSVTPAHGPVAGGNWAVVTGSGFSVSSKVVFGTTPSTRTIFVSRTELKALVPAHAAGTVSVVVTQGAAKALSSRTARYRFAPG